MLYVADSSDSQFGVKRFDISSGAPVFAANIPTQGNIEHVGGLSFDATSGNLLIADFAISLDGANSAEITTSGSVVNTFALGAQLYAFDIVALPSGSAPSGEREDVHVQGRTAGMAAESSSSNGWQAFGRRISRHLPAESFGQFQFDSGIESARDRAIATWLASRAIDRPRADTYSDNSNMAGERSEPISKDLREFFDAAIEALLVGD
jgi:hypothetical protein